MTCFRNPSTLTANEIKGSDKISSKRVACNEVESGSTGRNVKSAVCLTEPQGKIKNPQGKLKV